MIHAYSESYLYDAKQNLAECFDYAISNCRFNADIFSRLFVQSGYADKFERGNPAIVSGISGIELAQEIIMYAYMNYKFPEKIFSEERSEVYWAGWALAEYQWATCRRFKDIFSRIPLSEIVTMYSVYHEICLLYTSKVSGIASNQDIILHILFLFTRPQRMFRHTKRLLCWKNRVTNLQFVEFKI